MLNIIKTIIIFKSADTKQRRKVEEECLRKLDPGRHSSLFLYLLASFSLYGGWWLSMSSYEGLGFLAVNDMHLYDLH